MSKTQKGACSHAHQCRGCKYWYCSDDEISHCWECIFDEHEGLCYRCSGLMYPWRRLCKGHKKQAPKCNYCGHKRRQFKMEDDKIECVGCFRKKHDGRDPHAQFLFEINKKSKKEFCKGCYKLFDTDELYYQFGRLTCYTCAVRVDPEDIGIPFKKYYEYIK